MAIDSQYNQPDNSSLHILTAGLIMNSTSALYQALYLKMKRCWKMAILFEDTKSALILEDLIGQVLYSVGGSESKARE